MSEYAVSINWGEELTKDYDKWENAGYDAVERACKHTDMDTHSRRGEKQTNMSYARYCDKCRISEGQTEPMMNFGYPLDQRPSNERIVEIIKHTNLTVMVNTETDEVFLALTGGGMDLSQDIALAYLLAGERIPASLAYNVSMQPGLSQAGEQWERVANACEETLSNTASNYIQAAQRWKEAVKKVRAVSKKVKK